MALSIQHNNNQRNGLHWDIQYSLVILFRNETVNLKYTIMSVYLTPSNEGKSAAGFCRQVAAWFPDMFSNFYLAKNHKIAKNSTTTKAIEKAQIWNP